MVKYICEECGKECTAKKPSDAKRFCSHKCANIHRWKNAKKKETTLTCQNCGNLFTVKSSDSRLKNGTVKFCSKQCSSEAARVGKVKSCPICGKEFYTTRQTCCSKECAREYRKQHNTHKTYMENGYIVEYHGGYNKKGNVKQHRRIMEEHLGRRLTEEEVVHHINGIKTDNQIENLMVMNKREHSTYHRRQEKAEGRHLFGGYHNN